MKMEITETGFRFVPQNEEDMALCKKLQNKFDQDRHQAIERSKQMYPYYKAMAEAMARGEISVR